jgi:gliding motility-associated-like protein
VRITDNSNVSFGSVTRIVIFWDYVNNPGVSVTDNTPTTGELYTNTYPEFGSPASQTFRIRYEAYSGNSCVSVKTQDITLLATPTLEFNPVPEICSDAPAFQVTQASILNGMPGTFVFSGPGISPTGMFDPQAAGAGSHTIRYTYTGTNGCSNYKEQVIVVNPKPPVNAGPDKVVLEGGQVTLTPAVNASFPVTYLWTPSTGVADPTVLMAVVSPPFDMTYTLTVTSDKGCVSSDVVFVKVLKAPLIPNIFSPNGDGIHDKWDIAFLESYPGCTVDIYNRYGQLVYHSVGYSKPWDGTVNGKPVPVGTYYYIVDPKNGRQKYSGYVDVIR